MAIRQIKQVTFRDDQYPELLAKLNAVAPHEKRCVHDLAQVILLEKLDKLIVEHGINFDSTQPAAVVG